jgi:hypothetical protein
MDHYRHMLQQQSLWEQRNAAVADEFREMSDEGKTRLCEILFELNADPSGLREQSDVALRSIIDMALLGMVPILLRVGQEELESKE